VGTAHFADPRASEKLVAGLESWCQDRKVFEVSSLRGALRTESAGRNAPTSI
jgi:hypothetical protein